MGYMHASTCCCPRCCPPPPEPPEPRIEVEPPHVSELYTALAAKDAEIAKLTKELAALREEHATSYLAGVEAGKDAMRAEATKLREELEEARKVIEPMARFVQEWLDSFPSVKVPDGAPLDLVMSKFEAMSLHAKTITEQARAFLARKEAK